MAERPTAALVGYALYHFTFSSFRTNPRMWLEDLYVEPAARGTGAGEALLAAFVRDALARGCHRVDWDVLEWNPARAFYERMGATPLGRRLPAVRARRRGHEGAARAGRRPLTPGARNPLYL